MRERVTRWGQRIGKEPSEDLTRDEKVKGGNLFDAYDRIMEAKMKELLMEDLRARIESKRGARAKRADEGDGLEAKLDEILAGFKYGGMRGGLNPGGYELLKCQDPYHWQPCGVCLYCGGHMYLGNLPWGGLVICQRCGTQWSRTF